jgi:hypothetical protein
LDRVCDHNTDRHRGTVGYVRNPIRGAGHCPSEVLLKLSEQGNPLHPPSCDIDDRFDLGYLYVPDSTYAGDPIVGLASNLPKGSRLVTTVASG